MNLLDGSREPPRFNQAIQRFDEENSFDPEREQAEGQEWPHELLYARRLHAWVLKLSPQASEGLQLAARCQHICRWMIPRSDFEMNRAGYLQWRQKLKHFHASKAREILEEVGYPPETIAQVESLNLKSHFPKAPESQVLEDALCLVFLEHQLDDLRQRATEEKMLGVLRKTWIKMSPKAQAIALGLSLAEPAKALIHKAIDPFASDAN